MHRLHALAAFLFFLFGPFHEASAADLPYDASVTVEVADLRAKPSEPGPTRDHDPLQESQLLYGEPVWVLEEKEGWARVEAVEQQEWSHNKRWQGYPGWIKLSQLARDLPARKFPTRRQDPRPLIVEAAREFIGAPYYWGGRSPYDPNAEFPPHRGVDCSGLTGLAYQNNGLPVPRDAHEQWMKAKPLKREQLRPADLIFLSDPKDPKRITHVMLYAGGGNVIEAPGTGKTVRETGLDARLKEAAAEGRAVYFGTYLAVHGEPVEP